MILIEKNMAASALKEITLCEDVPEARSGHRCCATSNHLIVILCYNMTSKKWVVVPNSIDVRLESASCSMLLHDDGLLVFGGSAYPFGFTNSNKLSFFSLNTHQWSEVDGGESKDAPLPKYGHSMVMSIEYQKLYVFSGTIGNEFLDEMHCFDMCEKAWHKVECMNSPEARYRHEAVANKEHFYVLGGAITSYAYGFGHIDSFAFASHEWKRLSCKPSPDGSFPLPRMHHSCVLHKNNIYMAGGLTANLIACDDIWKINLDDLTWHRLDLKLPVPVFFHSAAASPDGHMFIFGGVINFTERTSALYDMWLDVPPLLNICLKYIMDRVCLNCDNKYQILKNLGIPSILLDRMFDEIPAG